ncbi:MAG TPA: ABC transporter ATP-binding protein [Candidatus Eisenbacteria bacterium]|nr:ABC transporter ATP-binding protein [Candidatus Eisenbacteria bacterium]
MDARDAADTPVLSVRGLEKSFGGRPVLAGVDLDVASGESVVVIGRSGGGKSVLLKHLVGLVKPDKGTVHVLGQDVTAWTRPQWSGLRGRIGMVFQGAALFDSLTVGENVAMGIRVRQRLAPAEEMALAKQRLAQVGLVDVEHLKPASLSGGMKKRVALARAVATDPEVLLYDEPTTGLDPVMADVINRLIRSLQQQFGLTSVVVTHDMTSAYFVGDRIAYLHQGRVHATGTPEEIRRSEDPIVRAFVEGRSQGLAVTH